jgi:hypothetical protein
MYSVVKTGILLEGMKNISNMSLIPVVSHIGAQQAAIHTIFTFLYTFINNFLLHFLKNLLFNAKVCIKTLDQRGSHPSAYKLLVRETPSLG